MDTVISSLLKKYDLQDQYAYEQAIREVVQHIALLGLWRANFFESAAFYGGTALRIIYGLQRFSEDLDFSLIEKRDVFKWDHYLDSVKTELIASGLEVSIEQKKKTIDSKMESAFIKANTPINMVNAYVPEFITNKLHRNQIIKIKFEIDTDPPAGPEFDVLNLLIPIPFQVRLFSMPDLFAGKIHAILCRRWKNRVKGRDYYDYVWFIGQNVPVRLGHLKNRLVQTGHWDMEKDLNRNVLIDLLAQKFNEVDFSQAKDDVVPFVKNTEAVKLWSAEFFIDISQQLEIV